MDFFELVGKRRSVRAYTEEPVSSGELDTILKMINAAPSAGNLQGYEVVVVRDQSKRDELAAAALSQTFIARAPVCLVFLANPKRSAVDYGERGRRLYCIQDATIAACHAHLACVALGLASVWVGAFSDERVRAAVSAPADMMPVCILPIGRPAEAPQPSPRRALGDLVHEERVGARWTGA